MTLTATAGSGSTFDGWSGACTGDGACALTIDSDQAVTGTFASNNVYLPLIVRGSP